MSDTPKRALEPSEIAKIEAETERVQAEIAMLRAETTAQTIVAETEAKKNEADAAKTKAETDAIELLTRQLVHDADREDEKRRDELAAHRYHKVYLFKGPVDDASAQRCMNQLTLWDRNGDDGDEYEIIFNSPGGSITAGMALWDHIQFIKSRGHKVTTSTIGMAASMAGILLQAGDKRIMGKESWLLIHQASFGASGSFGDVEDTVEWIKRIQERIIDIFASRSTLTRAEIKRKWTRTDWWISSDEALKWGLVDELR